MFYAIECCARIVMKIGSSRFSKVLMSVVAGSVGTIILAAFITGMSYQASIGGLLPVLIGFNAALSGYMVTEKTRGVFEHTRLVAMGTGVMMVLVTSYALNHLFLNGPGFYLIDLRRFLILLGVGSIAGLLGGMLAIQYYKLVADAT